MYTHTHIYLCVYYLYMQHTFSDHMLICTCFDVCTLYMYTFMDICDASEETDSAVPHSHATQVLPSPLKQT